MSTQISPTQSNSPSEGSSSPASESSSRPQGWPGAVAAGCSTVTSLIVARWISQAWFAGKIPDWRYALGAMVLVCMPTGVLLGLGKYAIKTIADKFPRGGK